MNKKFIAFCLIVIIAVVLFYCFGKKQYHSNSDVNNKGVNHVPENGGYDLPPEPNNPTRNNIKIILNQKSSDKLNEELNSKKITIADLQNIIIKQLDKETISTCLDAINPEIYLLLLENYGKLHDEGIRILILESISANHEVFATKEHKTSLITILGQIINNNYFATDYECSVAYEIIGKIKIEEATDLLLEGIYAQKGEITKEVIISNIGYRLTDDYKIHDIQSALYSIILNETSSSLVEQAMEAISINNSVSNEYASLIVNKLSDANPFIRENAVRLILRMNSEYDFLPYLEAQMYVETSDSVRGSIVNTIYQIAEKQSAINLYLKFLNSSISTGTKIDILDQLRHFNSEAVVNDKIIDMLKNSADYVLRSEAANTLIGADLQEGQVNDLFSILINEQNELVVSNVLYLLRSHSFTNGISQEQKDTLKRIYDNTNSESFKALITEIINEGN